MSRLPQYGKPHSFFSHLGGTGQLSGHETTIVAKLRKERERKPFRWVFKKFHNPVLAQIEAGIASLYYLIDPEHNPKIRVVYDEAGKAIGTVSKMFPNYMSLKAYLGDYFGVAGHEAETEKKLNALIDKGLAEVLTLSYFFEEDDLHLENIGVLLDESEDEITIEKVVRVDDDMSAYTIVAQDHVRGDRASYGRKPIAERFLLTDRDLSNLPCVEDADPWYCPTIYRASMDLPLGRVPHAYTKEQVQVFRTLTHHPIYSAKKFLTTVKITLFDDHVFSSRLAAHIQDEVSLEQCKKFITKKNELKIMLSKNAKFQSTCEKLLEERPLESIWKVGMRSFIASIAEFNDHLKSKHNNLFIEVGDIKNEYYALCCVIVQGGLLRSYNLLVDYIEHVSLEAYAKDEKKKNLYAAIVELRGLLVKNHQHFSELQKITVEQINSFVRNIHLGVCHAEAMYREVEKEETLPKLAAFFDEINLMLDAFIQYCSFLGDDICSERKALANDSFSARSGDGFVSVPVLQFDELMEDTVTWLQATKEESGQLVLANKATVEKIFEEMYVEFQVKNMSYVTQATAVVTSSFGFVTSFFVAPSPRIPTFFEELQMVKENLHKAQVPSAFCRAIAHLLIVERPGTEQFKNDFLSKIIMQFSREFSAEKLPKQMQSNPKLAEYLYAQANRQMHEVDIKSAVNFLTKKLATFHDSSEKYDCGFELLS